MLAGKSGGVRMYLFLEGPDDELNLKCPIGLKSYPLATPEETNMFISWAKELIRQFRLAWRLFKDRRVPWVLKLIPPAALIYVLSPIDILPDLSLGLGQLDDIAIVLLSLKLFIELAPPEVVREHLRALGAKIAEWTSEEPTVVEGEFEVREE
jgi:uncharacterized membrane protein YkvA (DUF1232 family)